MSGLLKTAWNRGRAEKLPPIEEIEQFGSDGEEAVYRALYEHFECVIRNAVVPQGELFLEKDFLVIERGIPFVIEVKNWKGEIGCRDGKFYQNKANGTHKTLKSPVETTQKFIDRMRRFYRLEPPVFGLVVFCETDCSIQLPEEMVGIALLPMKRMVSFIKQCAKSATPPKDPLAQNRVLRCTRFYSRDSEFCKGILADSYFDCKNAAGETVRVDTLSLRYLSVEPQPLHLRDKLLLTYVNGATDVFYNTDTTLTVGCLDGSYRKIALNRIRHVVF